MEQLFNASSKTVLTRVKKSRVNINEIDTESSFKLIITYQLPCSYAYFRKINTDFSVVCSLSSII